MGGVQGAAPPWGAAGPRQLQDTAALRPQQELRVTGGAGALPPGGAPAIQGLSAPASSPKARWGEMDRRWTGAGAPNCQGNQWERNTGTGGDMGERDPYQGGTTCVWGTDLGFGGDLYVGSTRCGGTGFGGGPTFWGETNRYGGAPGGGGPGLGTVVVVVGRGEGTQVSRSHRQAATEARRLAAPEGGRTEPHRAG